MYKAPPSIWKSLLPAFQWLPEYQRSWLRGDLTAGVTLAAYLLPAALGDASLAGLPPEAGLYACLFSGFVFWLFCSSRQTVVTVTSAISLLVGSSLGDFAAFPMAMTRPEASRGTPFSSVSLTA